MTQAMARTNPKPRRWLLSLLVLGLFAILVGLVTWQVQRLAWKEALIGTISERIASPPRPLSEIEALAAETGDVEYWPVEATGSFRHDAESHFFATWQGQPGFYVYTPLELEDGKMVFVNRGFVPYDRKDPATRAEGQIAGQVRISGLARNRLDEKPSAIVPDNEPDRNIFYWKDLDAMSARAGFAPGTQVLPFFIDIGENAVPGGLPVGGVTIIDLPNNHLGYAITWFGLAAALLGVFVMLMRRKALPKEDAAP